MSIAPKLQLILDTKAGLKSYLGIPNGVPFSQYVNWINWKGATPPSDLLFADYTKDRYSASGVPAGFSDVNEFTRLTAATNFIDGKLVEYAANKPRIEAGKGLMIEPSATNYFLNSHMKEDFKALQSVGGAWQAGGGLLFGVSNIAYEYNSPTSSPAASAMRLVLDGIEPRPYSLTERHWFMRSKNTVRNLSSSNIKLIGGSLWSVEYVDSEPATAAINSGFQRPKDYSVGGSFNSLFRYAQVEKAPSTSIIYTELAPATRSPDLNRITVPLGKTLTLDADVGVSFTMENATTALITATEPGYIRSARVN